MISVGARLGRYEILAPLGAGGMGEVYCARDTRLDRKVAVKVLPGAFASDPLRRARFEQEARAVAALSHPNVLAIHDCGTEGGTPFAVMELLEGEDLRATLARSPLPWPRALEVGAAVADGLAAAHARGIVHRDLKPENLFVTCDGQVKILDFGLARMEPPTVPGDDTSPYLHVRTDPGTVMGTVGYMSPEQVRGQAVDARSDLFSLGCVLYEMVSGQRPFRRGSAADTTAAILREEPAALGLLGVSVPPAVEAAIRRCLAKDPAARFPSAHDLASVLRAVAGGTEFPPTAPPTAAQAPLPAAPAGPVLDALAVLPLVNTSADPDTEYLADGITESLITLLSRLPGLRVMARSTVFRYKGREVDVQEVGRALQVRAVLTGRLLQRGARLILKAELVNVADGALLWGERYDRQMTDLFATEEALARDIAEQLRLRLSGDNERRLARSPAADAATYQLYLKGRYHWNKRTAEGLRKSVQLFEQAIDRDPAFALAYAGLADAYTNLGGWGHLPPREAYPRAKTAASRALALDEHLAEAHASLGMVRKEYDWDWAGAERSYLRALQLNPNYAIAHQWYGEYLAARGRHDEAIAAIGRALDLDPLSLIIHATLGRHGYFFARQYDRAAEQLHRTLEMDADFWVAYHFLGAVYACLGRLDEARTAFETARRLNDNLEMIAGLGYVHGRAGRRGEALALLDELKEKAARGYVSPILSALIWTGLGDNDQAFAWLDRAVEDRTQWLSEIMVDSFFDPLRPDPRFQPLLRQVGFLP